MKDLNVLSEAKEPTEEEPGAECVASQHSRRKGLSTKGLLEGRPELGALVPVLCHWQAWSGLRSALGQPWPSRLCPLPHHVAHLEGRGRLAATGSRALLSPGWRQRRALVLRLSVPLHLPSQPCLARDAGPQGCSASRSILPAEPDEKLAPPLLCLEHSESGFGSGWGAGQPGQWHGCCPNQKTHPFSKTRSQ